jgi:hypothetical protein
LFGSNGLVHVTKSMGMVMESFGYYCDLVWIWFGKKLINGSIWVDK